MSSCKRPSRRSRYDWCTCAATQVRECGTGMEAKHKRPRHLFKFRWAQCMYRPIISTCMLGNASGTTLPGTEGSSGLESSGRVSSSLASSAFMAAILFCDSLGTPSWKHPYTRSKNLYKCFQKYPRRLPNAANNLSPVRPDQDCLLVSHQHSWKGSGFRLPKKHPSESYHP